MQWLNGESMVEDGAMLGIPLTSQRKHMIIIISWYLVFINVFQICSFIMYAVYIPFIINRQ